MSRVVVVMCLAVGLWLACAQQAQAADYTTCFAFDPVFVQADQRSAPAVAKAPEAEPAGRPVAAGKPVAAPRLSLKALAKALESLSATVKSPANDSLGR